MEVVKLKFLSQIDALSSKRLFGTHKYQFVSF